MKKTLFISIICTAAFAACKSKSSQETCQPSSSAQLTSTDELAAQRKTILEQQFLYLNQQLALETRVPEQENDYATGFIPQATTSQFFEETDKLMVFRPFVKEYGKVASRILIRSHSSEGDFVTLFYPDTFLQNFDFDKKEEFLINSYFSGRYNHLYFAQPWPESIVSVVYPASKSAYMLLRNKAKLGLNELIKKKNIEGSFQFHLLSADVCAQEESLYADSRCQQWIAIEEENINNAFLISFQEDSTTKVWISSLRTPFETRLFLKVKELAIKEKQTATEATTSSTQPQNESPSTPNPSGKIPTTEQSPAEGC